MSNKTELARYCKKKLIRMIVFPLRLFPVRNNRVLLINASSSHYSCNLKYIGEEIRRRRDSIELIYAGRSLDCVNALKEKNIVPVNLNSIMYFWYGMTSKVLVTNSGGISYLPLKKCQYTINTWHGGGAYKRMGIDSCENTKLFRKDLALISKETDIWLATCERFKNVYCKSMLENPEKFWCIGMPRNDLFKNIDLDKVKEVRKKLGLKDGEKLVLFAPTYRNQNDNWLNDAIAVAYDIDEKATREALEKRFGGKWIFAYHFHPNIMNRKRIEESDITIDLTDYDDMQELLLVADVLINDFSSSMWDFMLTGKPCFIFAKDLQHYIETRGLYTPVSEWPFPIAESNEKLISNILSFDESTYAVDCKKHYELLGGCETGEATRIVCDWIEGKCDCIR